MKIKLKFLFVFFTLISVTNAQELLFETKEETPIRQQFGYIGIGVGPLPIPIPGIVGGYRIQKEHGGPDFSLQVLTLFRLTQVKVSVLYLSYPHPNPQSQFYIGAGIAPTFVIGSRVESVFTLSPEFVIGKQYRSSKDKARFFQIQIGFPLLLFERTVLAPGLPFITVQYGIGF